MDRKEPTVIRPVNWTIPGQEGVLLTEFRWYMKNPLFVYVDFLGLSGEVYQEWIIGRELFSQVITAGFMTAGRADVVVSRTNSPAKVELHLKGMPAPSRNTELILNASKSVLREFLEATYEHVRFGEEVVDVDSALAEWFAEEAD